MIKQIQAFDTKTFRSLLDTPFQTRLTKLALIVSSTADGWLYFVLLPIIIGPHLSYVAIGTKLMHGLETQLSAWQLSRLTTPASFTWTTRWTPHRTTAVFHLCWR